MLVIVFVMTVLLTVIAQEAPIGYLFYTDSVINLDQNKTSYMVGCSLNYTDISEGVMSHHLAIVNLKRTPYETQVINDTTIAHEVDLRVSNESEICGNKEYICRLNRTLIGKKTIHVARSPPPIQASDLKCISHNRKYLICEFRRQNSCRLTTFYKLSMNRLGLLSDCELFDNVSILSYDSRSETCMFSAGQRNISFIVDSKNVVGKTESSIVVNHYDIVRPSAPTNLQVPFINSSSVQVTWNLSIMLLNLDRKIEIEFLMVSKYKNESSFLNITLEKDVPVVHQFNDLYAYTNYELKIRARVIPKSFRNFEDEYWSDWSSVQIRTKACKPYQVPRTAPGAYSFKERRDELVTVEVYWEPVPEYYHNGLGFDYDVFAVSAAGERFNVSQPVHPNGVATFQNIKADERYTVHLSSYNDEGRSENVSHILIYPPEEGYNPNIKRILYNNSYHLQWFSTGKSEDISNYTVMHCTFSATGSCQSSINIITLPPNTTSYSINSSKPLNFALAANYRFYSSDLSWMQCIVPTPSNISRLSSKLTDVTEHSVTLRLFLSCTDQSLVERYEVSYWPKMDKSLERNMTKHPYDMSITIEDLMMDTEYAVKVIAYDANGVSYQNSHVVRTSDRSILLQLIVFLMFGILVMAIMTTTVARKVKKMMNIKVDIPLGLLGIDEMPINFPQNEDSHYVYEEIDAKVLFSDLLEKDELIPIALYDIDDNKQSVNIKSILKKRDDTAHNRNAVQNEYIEPSFKDNAKPDLLTSGNRSSGSSGYVDVNLMMKQQMIR